MDFAKSLMVLLRRWYVTLPALVISLGFATMVFGSVPATYASRGTLVLLSPSTGSGTGQTGPANPLLSFDGSLTTVSTALIQVLLSPDIAKDLAQHGATADFQVGDGNLRGPFIHVEATGASPAEAQRTVSMVMQRAGTELNQREIALRAPLNSYIQLDYLVRPTKATRLLGSKIRAAGATLALALAFSISSAFMIESIAENRRDKRRRKPAGNRPAGNRPASGPAGNGPARRPAVAPAPFAPAPFAPAPANMDPAAVDPAAMGPTNVGAPSEATRASAKG